MTLISTFVIAKRRASRCGNLINCEEYRTDSKRLARLLRSTRNDKMMELVLCIILILTECVAGQIPEANAASLQMAQGQSSVIANPASVNCVDKGGELIIQMEPDGGEYGICRFKDGKECEEWAMMRGECSAGGVKVAGLATPAARFCMIRGGIYTVTALTGTKEEQGTCSWKNGDWCEVWEYYNGLCGNIPAR